MPYTSTSRTTACWRRITIVLRNYWNMRYARGVSVAGTWQAIYAMAVCAGALQICQMGELAEGAVEEGWHTGVRPIMLPRNGGFASCTIVQYTYWTSWRRPRMLQRRTLYRLTAGDARDRRSGVPRAAPRNAELHSPQLAKFTIEIQGS
eukprot:scaffold952_cov409-Prasinococcus_capsulatus_cf.AAC.40